MNARNIPSGHASAVIRLAAVLAVGWSVAILLEVLALALHFDPMGFGVAVLAASALAAAIGLLAVRQRRRDDRVLWPSPEASTIDFAPRPLAALPTRAKR